MTSRKSENILNENRFPGLAQIDSSSLDFPLGGNESSLRSVLDIHDSSERESQQRGKPKCEEYITQKLKNGAPDWIRTSDPWLRRSILYPTELRAP